MNVHSGSGRHRWFDVETYHHNLRMSNNYNHYSNYKNYCNYSNYNYDSQIKTITATLHFTALQLPLQLQ